MPDCGEVLAHGQSIISGRLCRPCGQNVDQISCYSQRMLNPYRGIFSCIRYLSAEAVTADGVHWDIFVSNDSLREGIDSHVDLQTSDIRFGKWSLESGLRRGPMYPSEDFQRMEQMGEVVYRHLLKFHSQVPFPLADHCEHWLLDSQGVPLALIDSALGPDDISSHSAEHWRCGNQCLQEFTSASLGNQDSGQQPAGQWLMQQLEQCTGSSLKSRWFLRLENGDGQALDNGACLSSEHFPLLPLRSTGFANQLSRVIHDFIAWQSPWLLQLVNLSDDYRRKLEKLAVAQALMVDKLYRLYPTVIDSSLIKAARVEARLRRSSDEARVNEVPDARLATYYIEPDERPFQ